MNFDKYYMISCKENKDLDKPFISLINLLKDRDLLHNQDESSIKNPKEKDHDSLYQSKLSNKSNVKLTSKDQSASVSEDGCFKIEGKKNKKCNC